MSRVRPFDGRRSDTGWTSLTLSTGTGTLRWRCRNGQVEVRANVSGATIANTTTVTLSSGIPAAYCPTSTVTGGAQVAAGGAVGALSVNTAGAVTITQQSGAAVGLCVGSITYLLG